MLLRQIKYFQTIVEKGSFSDAAADLYISQSAVSQQMQALEKELGVALFERHNRRFTLTEAGEHFYKKSLVITAELEQLQREVVRIDRRDEAVLSLGVLVSYDGEEFHRAIAAFAEAYPSVRLNILRGNHEELYHALRTEKIDLALNDQRRAFSDAYENVVLARARAIVRDLWQGLATIAKMEGKWQFLLYTVLIWGCYFLQLYIASKAFSFTSHLGVLPVLVLFVLSSIGMAVPSNGGLGPWQFAIIFGLSLYGVGAFPPSTPYDAQASAFSWLVWGVQQLLLIVLGIFAFLCIAVEKKKPQE